MSFQPVAPFGGVVGWEFIKRTRDNQADAFANSTTIQRNTEYFRDNIANAKSAEDLVNDRRLLEVALGRFGLGDDINNKAFILKVLEDGVLKEDALSNRLADKRYYEFSKAFGYGDFSVANTQLSDFADKILPGYHEREFELAIGNQNEDMRLALGFQRDLDEIFAKETSADGYWFNVMGSPPLRRVFETAFGLPTGLGGLDLDQQLTQFREKAERFFGDSEIAQFSDPEKQEKLLRMFLVRSELDSGATGISSSSAALALLQSSAQTVF